MPVDAFANALKTLEKKNCSNSLVITGTIQFVIFRLKNAMKPYAQMNARVKKDRLLAFNRRIQDTEASRIVFNEWELELDQELIKISGVRLNAERLDFGNNRTIE